MKERGVLAIGLLGVVFVIILISFISGAVVSHTTSGDFIGTYLGTFYNSSGFIQLNSTNLTGNYTSQIIDAGDNVLWNNFSWNGIERNASVVYAVDNLGDVYVSSNLGMNWSQKADNYGQTSDTREMTSDNIYIYIIASANREVWRSSDFGQTFSIINNSLVNRDFENIGVNNSGAIYIADSIGGVHVSLNYGVSWNKVGDFNAGNTNTPKGLAISKNTNTLYSVDASGAVFMSTNNSGINWTLKNNSFGGGAGTDDLDIDSLDNLYILFNKEIYKSINNGTSWSLINDSFTSFSNDGVGILIDASDRIYVTDANGRIFISNNYGVSWDQVGDFNAGVSNTAKGITSFVQKTNITFQFRNCSSSDCSDGSFRGPDGTGNSFYTNITNNLNLASRYSQYRVYFQTPSMSDSSQLSNVSLDYSTLNSAPSINLVHPSSGEKFRRNNSIPLNFSVSDLDGNLQACWYSLDNGNNISLSGCNNITFDTNEGNHTLIFYSNDSLNAVNYTNISFGIDSILPSIIISYPSNNSFNYVVSNLNYSVSDVNLQACWYSLDNGLTNISIICGINITDLNSGQGSSTWKFYANDSFGNIGNSSIIFSVDSVSPSVSISYPSDGSSLGSNTSISLNFTSFDLNKQACWYSLDNGNNISLSGCNNITFDTSSGSHSLRVYVNDSIGNLDYDENNFSIQIGAPSIILNSPTSGEYLNHSLIQLNYTASDIDLQSCELWGNFTGSFALNQTNLSAVSGSIGTFNLNLSDGAYLWNVRCSDNIGNSAFNGNKTFVVDTTSPVASISQPSGTKTSRNSIPLSFSLTEQNKDSCWYNVLRGNNLEVGNTSVNCSSGSSSFSVTLDADFVLWLYSNDSAGNKNSASSSFSVSTSSSSSSTTSSGGGGGGGSSNRNIIVNNTLPPVIVEDTISLKTEVVRSVVENPSEKKSILVSVKNTGSTFLNSCSLSGKGDKSSWIYSSDSKNIAGGELSSFVAEIQIPFGTSPGEYSIDYEINCIEKSADGKIYLDVLEKKLGFTIKKTNRERDLISISYLLEELSSIDQRVEMQFVLLDRKNQKVSEFVEIRDIGSNEKKEFETKLEIPSSLNGEFTLFVNINSNTYSTIVREEIVLGKAVSGLAIFNNEGSRNNLIKQLSFLLFGTFLVYMGVRIFKLRKVSVEQDRLTKGIKVKTIDMGFD